MTFYPFYIQIVKLLKKIPYFIRLNLFFYLFFSLLCSFSFAQITGNSPYTGVGIGEIYSGAFAHQAGYGGGSVSYSPIYFINGQNPALLARSSNLIFEAGIAGQYKQIQSIGQSQLDLGGGLMYVSILVPITSRWVSNFGIAPYSIVNYENRFRQRIINSDFIADYTFKGAGGISTVYWSNGVRVNKNLYLGLKASYLYGTINQETGTRLFTNRAQDYKITLNEKLNYSGILIEPAAAVKVDMGKDRFFNVGLVYSLQSNVPTRKFIALEQRNVADSFIFGDTLQDNLRGKTLIPARYALGFSLEKQYEWAVIADFSLQNWKNFYNFDTPQPLTEAFSVTLGGEFVPDYTAIKGYFKRVIYRGGLHYVQTPVKLQNTQINDFSVNLGLSLPVSRNSSLLNFAFALGQRGVTSNDLVRERYFKFNFGVTINDRKFQRRRID